MDCETVEPAPDANTAQERHQQDALGVALSISVREHLTGGNVVGPIVAECNFVAHKVVDRANPVVLR